MMFGDWIFMRSTPSWIFHLLASNIPLILPSDNQSLLPTWSYWHQQFFWVFIFLNKHRKAPKRTNITLIFLEHSCPNFLTTYQSFCHDRRRIKVVSLYQAIVTGIDVDNVQSWTCFDIFPQHMLRLDDATQTYRMSCESTTNGSSNGIDRYGSHSC